MCPQRNEVDTSTAISAVDTLGRRVAPRRYRTVEEKIQIVTESRMPGASVAEVARCDGVNANQVFTWRLQQEQGVLGRRGDVYWCLGQRVIPRLHTVRARRPIFN